MATVITLEVGDSAAPVVDIEFTDSITGVEVLLPTAGAPVIVIGRTQVSIDLETDTPIYAYQVQFVPTLVVPYIVPADPEDPESVEQELSVTVQFLGLDNSQLGLIEDEVPLIDVTGIQQAVDEAKQISSSSLSTATVINDSVQQEDASSQSFGRSEILTAVQTMEKNDTDIQGRDVIGLDETELRRMNSENRLTAQLLSSDQQIILEYVDNLFAFRSVLVEIDEELKDSAEQSNEQLLRGLEDDQDNADAFNDLYLAVPEAQNSFQNPSDFSYPVDTQNEEVYPDFSEIATLMQSSLLNPQNNPPVIINPPSSVIIVEDDSEFQPIIPPGTEE